MENPIKMDDLGVPLFSETPICRKPRFPDFPPFGLGMNKARKEALQQRQLCVGSEEIDGKKLPKMGEIPNNPKKKRKVIEKSSFIFMKQPKNNSKVIEKVVLFYLLQKVIGVLDS